jgi:hypothetical protein
MHLFKEQLLKKLKVLNETTWDHKVKLPNIEKWLSNFKDDNEQINALFLLSQFIYINDIQLRELLKRLYRDLFKYPIVQEIRKQSNGTTDFSVITSKFQKIERATRFIGIGNPSESGAHLLYVFRTENQIANNLFLDASQIADDTSLKDTSVKQYIFIDDFCGTGSQADKYLRPIVTKVRSLDPTIKLSYLMLFATKVGRDNVIKSNLFDNVQAVVDLDDSFKCFHNDTRYYINDHPPFIDKDFTQNFCEEYGKQLWTTIYNKMGVKDPKLTLWVERDKLGYKDSQLLIGFPYNTPDNTLPIIWYNEGIMPWSPIFKRHNKIYK